MARTYIKPAVHPLDIATRIPPAVAASVGRVVITSGLIEHHLLLNAKRLMGINIAKARISFSNVRWSDYVQRIEILAEMVAFDLGLNAKDLVKRMEVAEERRNLLVHSVWLESNGILYVQRTRGRYTPGGVNRPIRRAESPERIAVNKAFLDESKKMLRECLSALKKLERRTTRLLSSP